MKVIVLSVIALIGLASGQEARADGYFLGAGRLDMLPRREMPPCMSVRPVAGAEFPCVLAKLGPSEPAAARLGRHLLRAEGFILHRRKDLAAQEVEEALASYPDEAAAWHMSARLKLTQGEKAAARVDLDRALTLDDRNANIWATRAVLQSDQTDMLQDLDKALQLDPSNLFALVSRTEIYADLGREPPERDIVAIASIDPHHPLASDYRLKKATAEGRIEAAVAELDSSVEHEPYSMHQLMRRAGYLQMFGRHEGAVRDLNAILGAGSQSPRYAIIPTMAGRLYLSRAMSHKALGHTKEARDDILRAMKGAPTSTILRTQIFLRSKGYPDVPISGTITPEMEDAAVSCMLNEACGRGITSLS